MNLEQKSMRDVFIDAIYERMKGNDKIFFVSADFGSPKLDRLRRDFSDRFLNVGIAEQNLLNVSTGLALEGFTVYAYAIAPFLTMRAYEQIRNNLSLMSHVRELNVNLIGVGAGLSYDVAGPTHHCLEDISILRNLPNMVLFSPSDWYLVQEFADYSLQVKAPKYLRFDGKPLRRIYGNGSGINSGINMKDGFTEIKKGSGICIVSTGFMTHRALEAAARLARQNLDVGVIDFYVLKPFNEESFRKVLGNYACVITIEEAFINKGGLDSIVACAVNGMDTHIKRKHMGFGDSYVFDMGSRDALHRLYGLDEDGIIKNILECVKDLA
ncbi:MAG: transketolase [Nitrospirae bacterium]|nr:transketolase [Nitrospirota bacterium]